MPKDRAELIFSAQVAEKAERFDDMVEFMQQCIISHSSEPLTIEERNLLSVAYKNAVSHRRMSWRMVNQLQEKQTKRGNVQASLCAETYKRKIEDEIRSMSNGLLQLIQSHLLKTAAEPAATVFYKKLAGDHNRYMAEFSVGEQKDSAIVRASESYKDALHDANTDLRPPHPVRLALLLNYAVFTYEVLNKQKEAVAIAEDAYRSAGTVANSPDYRDSTLVMQMLKDNIRVWTESD